MPIQTSDLKSLSLSVVLLLSYRGPSIHLGHMDISSSLWIALCFWELARHCVEEGRNGVGLTQRFSSPS